LIPRFSGSTCVATQSAILPELKRVLGTDIDLTVFRKLKQIEYLASYTHPGRFYTLAEIAHFDDHGLWSQ
jgi:hypothetical protein